MNKEKYIIPRTLQHKRLFVKTSILEASGNASIGDQTGGVSNEEPGFPVGAAEQRSEGFGDTGFSDQIW